LLYCKRINPGRKKGLSMNTISARCLRSAVFVLSAILQLQAGSGLLAATNCTPAPSGLISWWQAEGNANDFFGLNNGSLINGAGFAPGKVGQAFAFITNGEAVIVPNAPSLNPTSGLTIEGWVYVNAFVAIDASLLVGKDSWSDWSRRQYQLAIQKLGSGWVFRSNVTGSTGDNWLWGSTQVQLDTWYHVAMTYDGSVSTLYVNGAFETSTPVIGPIHVDVEPLRMGGYGEGPWDLAGFLDEVSLYNRALTHQEIAAIYNAGSFGKCAVPVPPVILVQPTDQTVGLGGTISFAATVEGSPPLAYQWLFAGNIIPGATLPILTLDNVQLAQAGAYALLVTNAYGSVLSSNAVLSVSTNCAPVPSGLVSWWPGNGNATDIFGPNNGTFIDPSFVPGEVGSAFSFNGSDSAVHVPASPSLDVGAGGGLTIEAWINPVNSAQEQDLVEWNNGAGFIGTHMTISVPYGIGGPGSLWANFMHGAGSPHPVTSAAGLLLSNVFQHVAATYDKASGAAALYLNGQVVAQTNIGSFTPYTSADMYVGWRPSGPFTPLRYTGAIDELSLYSRALSASEIQSIYNAGSNGKCTTPTPPSIYLQPANQTVVAGQSATFTVGASGTVPLSFQWFFGGTALPGATNPSLTLSNVQFSQAGTYSVVITNGLGAITSSNAQLAVVFPAATVEVTSLSNAPSGTSITVPVLLLANGNENGLGFSLNFPPVLLQFASAALGSGASGASLVINTNQIGSGILGIAITLPADAKWAAGTQDLLDVTFATAIVTNATIAAISFSDQPVLRQLADVSGNPLAANFVGGTITLSAAGLEGDVWPRPNGDEALTISDWVVEGRYVARLDYPTNSSEFQRADCAPRSTLGDGQITVMDWVQVGRYVAGLDPVTVAGGRTNETTGPSTLPNSPEPKLVARQLLVTSGSLFSGQAAVISVDLVSQGNENALGFSIDYDSTLVALAGVSTGANAAAATFNINTNHAGRVGVALALPAGTSFPAGTQELLRLNFKSASANSTTTTSALSLSDLPVLRQVADSRATALAARYVNGSISLNPPPALSISQTSSGITLAWPLWATNFSPQEAKGSPVAFWSNIHTAPVSTNNQNLITLPLGPGPNFYRLSK
jgi:hypothetical protein